MVISGYILLILAFIDGLFFGLAIKKGIASAILIIIAFIIAWYAGFAFVPKLSPSQIGSSISSFVSSHIAMVPKLLGLTHSVSFSIVLVLFIIGLGIGIWKG
ncbi:MULTISPECIES: hypothetical protein [Acidiplasma]|jgi:hypothetical protein|uniref:Uncharacterized protein n=1 Tax=Acidiplasma aeolicum TaxID=507754 RepID=A0A0Q0RQY2_9ARCH|nr:MULTISPECIES: hypothetical protein [Acidiplasma]KQB34762.1 hypothetical protein AOG54_00610 [Acidiplasma aeolicum]WMT55702.1 MAG: hypothetical protein RE470_03405 [Acidiplasma sp.]